MSARAALQPEGRGIAAAGASPGARRRWLAAAGLLLAALVLPSLAGRSPHLVERYYSRGLYPYIGRGLGSANSLFSFSLTELLLVMVFVGLLGVVLWQSRRLYLKRVTLGGLLLSGLLRSVWLAGGGVMLFLFIHGLNYQRPPLGETLGLERRQANSQELETISRSVIANINRNYEEARAGNDWAEGSRLPLSRPQLYEVIEAAYRREPLLAFAGGGFGPPKPVYLSPLMSRLGIGGLFSPFTGEPNFNAEQPDCELPFSIAHEMAHQRGFAREDEANFVAFLVCAQAAHPYVRYVGHLRALNVAGLFGNSLLTEKVGGDLSKATSEDRRQALERYREVYHQLGAGPRADLSASSKFWGRYRGQLQQVSRRVNDTYLKANGVRSGVGNYGEVLGLVIDYYLAHPEALAAPVEGGL